ncbi:hypothetical protein Tco_1044897 [Tanacetum coccineum]|uniref:Retrovirus-related Pol polyprotein from transposon TNT 1-94-like beta-barrel domain-containing protein n=1 Tax=Tanacetum coccineum TaxID=301880 RepID=A0ABQ5GTE2_9ASTR
MESKGPAIEESQELTSFVTDESSGYLQSSRIDHHESSKCVKAKGERKSLALKAKKESSDEECLNFRSEDEEYAMAVRDFKKFFKRRGRFVRQPRNDKKTFQRSRDDKNSKGNRKCFRCGSWSGSGEEDDEKVKDETYLVAQASSKICLGVDLEPDEWIKDSGCSKHMTGNRKLFSTYKAYNGGNVIFGSNLLVTSLAKDGKVRSRSRIASKIYVRNLPKLQFDQPFVILHIGKQLTLFQAKNMVSTTRCLELLHMDLFGPYRRTELRRKRTTTLSHIDDYSSI